MSGEKWTQEVRAAQFLRNDVGKSGLRVCFCAHESETVPFGIIMTGGNRYE